MNTFKSHVASEQHLIWKEWMGFITVITNHIWNSFCPKNSSTFEYSPCPPHNSSVGTPLGNPTRFAVLAANRALTLNEFGQSEASMLWRLSQAWQLTFSVLVSSTLFLGHPKHELFIDDIGIFMYKCAAWFSTQSYDPGPKSLAPVWCVPPTWKTRLARKKRRQSLLGYY